MALKRFSNFTVGLIVFDGGGDICLEQAGMHAEAQLDIIQRFIEGQ